MRTEKFWSMIRMTMEINGISIDHLKSGSYREKRNSSGVLINRRK